MRESMASSREEADRVLAEYARRRAQLVDEFVSWLRDTTVPSVRIERVEWHSDMRDGYDGWEWTGEVLGSRWPIQVARDRWALMEGSARLVSVETYIPLNSRPGEG